MGSDIHSVPGRLRIKVFSIKRDLELCRNILRLIMDLDGVHHVATNHITGSVTVRYDAKQLRAATILVSLTKNGFLGDSNALMNVASRQSSSSKAGLAVSKILFGWVVEKALEPTGLSFLAAFI